MGKYTTPLLIQFLLLLSLQLHKPIDLTGYNNCDNSE